MTLGEIFERVKWIYFGDTGQPTSVDTHYQAAAEGVISNIHRKIQEDNDYWFMEKYYSTSVSAYTRNISLPDEFKHEVEPVRVLRFSSDTYTAGTADCSSSTTVTGTTTAWETSWSGRKYQISWDSVTWYNILAVTSATTIILDETGPSASGTYTIRKCTGAINLDKITSESTISSEQDMNGSTTYPIYYDIWDNLMNFYPLFTENIAVDFRYYRYLDRPSAFVTHSDALTENAADLLIFSSVAELSASLDNQKYVLYSQKAAVEEKLLKNKHFSRRSGGFLNLRTNWNNRARKFYYSEFQA